MAPHHHRTNQNKLKKQHNKKNKQNNGKQIAGTTPVANLQSNSSKLDRKTHSKNIAKNKKEKKIEDKKCFVQPPKTIAFIAFHDEANPYLLKRKCLAVSGMKEAEVEGNIEPYKGYTIKLPDWAQPSGSISTGRPKERVTLIDVPTRDKFSILDICKTADLVVCCFGPNCSLNDRCFDDLGYETMTALKSQGIPMLVGAIQGIDDDKYINLLDQFKNVGPNNEIIENISTINSTMEDETLTIKRKDSLKKLISRFFTSEFPNGEKIFSVDSELEIKTFIRHLGNTPGKELSWRKDRGYLNIDNYEYNLDQKQLGFTGYMKGCGFDINHLVHLTGLGDFEIESIEVINDICPIKHNKLDIFPKIINSKNYDMDRLREYVPEENEQTFPTKEEMLDIKKNHNICPKDGFKSDDEDMDIDDEEELLNDNIDDGLENLRGFAKDPLRSTINGTTNGDNNSDYDWSDLNEDVIDEWEKADQEAREKPKKFEFERRAIEDLEFPDEIDTPLNQEAKKRFEKYRGLRSFKTSSWDCYEDLPIEYSRIYEFEGYKSCVNTYKKYYQSQILESYEKCNIEYIQKLSQTGNNNISHNLPLLSVGQYVLIKLKNFSEESYNQLINMNLIKFSNNNVVYTKQSPIIVSNLFECERKISVMHLQCHRITSCTDSSDNFLDKSIKSKSLVELHCGFRKFQVKPIYSKIPKKAGQNDKHAYNRFFHPGQSCIASFYAPVMFTPCPVLIFDIPGQTHPEHTLQEATETSFGGRMSVYSNCTTMTNISTVTTTLSLNNIKNLVAWGEVLEANPKRLIVKRICLAGHPLRVHKNKAVVRHMFFNNDDIKWFKPVELTTKQGLRGNIKESLGTHGLMKCIFNDRLKQNDTICMNLYKRQFPSWYSESWGKNQKPDDYEC